MRLLAARFLQRIVEKGITIDQAVGSDPATQDLDIRDRAFLRSVLFASFRHRGEIDSVLKHFINRQLPRKSGLAPAILWSGAAQLLFLDVPAHSVIDLAVRCAKSDSGATHFSGLINAVLRRIASDGKVVLGGLDNARLNTPPWLWSRWCRNYGESATRSIAAVHAGLPYLDITAAQSPEYWAERLGGELLPTGQIRLPPSHGPVVNLPGFSEGAWWVQDAAAALPVKLFGDLAGKKVLDLCAAPGGKTMQLCAAGAEVTAVDASVLRLGQLRENLERTVLSAKIIEADVLDVHFADLFDGVLLDAPCSATGTIRRHPELPYIKGDQQVLELAQLQGKMLRIAAALVRPGGQLVYCTCSLEPQEGEEQVMDFLQSVPGFELSLAHVEGLPAGALQSEGWIRTLPRSATWKGSRTGRLFHGLFAASCIGLPNVMDVVSDRCSL